MSFELTILGSGTSQGVPVIGRDYPAAFLANPKNHRFRPAAMVRTDEVRFVIDTPPEFRLQMLREGVKSIDAVLYTHAHADHILGLDDCRRFCEMAEGSPLPLYAGASDMKLLRHVFGYAFTEGRKPRTYLVPEPRVFDGPFDLGDLRVTPLPLPHGSMGSNGFLFERGEDKLLAYCTDCKEVPDSVVERIAGVRCVVLDALRKREHWTHMSLDEALTAARRIRAERTLLTHLTDEYDHDPDQAELPPGVELAYDGLKLDLA